MPHTINNKRISAGVLVKRNGSVKKYNKIRLIKPAAKYRESFLTGIQEIQREEGKNKVENFNQFLTKMRLLEKGSNLPEAYVPASYYWLIDGSEFIGETTLRHKLTRALQKRGGHIGYAVKPSKRGNGYGKIILKLALQKAKKRGIKEVLITCDDDNVPSWKTIESNGGVLKDKVKDNGKLIRRYKVKTE